MLLVVGSLLAVEGEAAGGSEDEARGVVAAGAEDEDEDEESGERSTGRRGSLLM